jgi:HEAT repeat protein
MQHHISDTVPGLRVALHNSSPEVRAIAAGFLAEDNDVASIPAIERAIARENDRSVKAGMARSLKLLQDWQSREPLRKTCADTHANADARLLTANQLLDAGELECDAAVIAILGDRPTQTQRDLAMRYLRRRYLIPEALLPAARAEAVEELRDPNPLDRQYAGECISVLGDRPSLEALRKATEAETDPETKRHMAESLKRLQTALAQYPSHP